MKQDQEVTESLQAVIHKIIPFDSSVGTAIKFSWNGNQIFKNRCMIKENETNEIIYDNTIDSFKPEHIVDLSKAALENGKQYNAYITVFDKDHTESDIQPLGEPFLCLKTPTFRFTDITDGQSISSSSHEFHLEYDQENGELLNSWSVSVYTKNHSLLSTSGIKYDTRELKHVISGFNNKNEYIVRAVGQTVNGFPMDTGDINISVDYTTNHIFSILDPTNLKDIGAIQIRSNIVSSEGHLKYPPGTYIGNECLDLRNNILTYREGFLFNDDFSLVLYFYGMRPNQQILRFYDDSGELSAVITYRITKVRGIGEDHSENNILSSYFELMIVSSGYSSVYYSNVLPILSESDKIGLCIVRKDNLYNIEISPL